MRILPYSAVSTAILAAALLGVDPSRAFDRLGDPGKLVVGIDEAFPPFEYVENGEPRGFDVELMRAIGAEIGYEVEFQAAPWHEIRARLESGAIDLTPAMVWSQERDAQLDFSIPIVGGEYTAFVREDTDTRTPRELIGMRVLVQERGYLHDFLLTAPFEVQVATAPSPLEALQRLAGGDADGALLLDAQGLYLIREHGIRDLRSLGAPLRSVYFRIAVTAGRTDLLALLNDGLTEVRQKGLYDEIFDRWFGVLKPPSAAVRRVIQALAAGGLLALVGVGMSTLWSLTLRRRVAAARLQQHELERRLRDAEKLEALGRLAGGVAHDFNNYLTVILGSASVLRDGGAAARDELLDEIDRAVHSAANLTRQLISFARGQVSLPGTLTWKQVLRDAPVVLRRFAPDDVEIEEELEEPGWAFRMDPAQASQVLLNLFVNAVDASVGGGRIEVRVTNEEAEGGSQWVCLAIRDHGTGMDESTRERVFEPFFSTKGALGAGLGLSTVHGIVQQAGGRVEVESEPGGGSTFRVRLPRSEEPETHVAPVAAAPGPGRPLRILLVDDDRSVLDTVGLVLEAMGHRCDRASEARSALARVEAGGVFDVLIVDISMPDLSGTELVGRLRELEPRLPVIFTSGLPRDARELVEAGADPSRFLAKPIEREALGAMLASAVEAGP